MVTAEKWMSAEFVKRYKVYYDDQCTVWHVGIIAYEDENGIIYDTLKIAHLAISGQLNHNKLYGFYRIVVKDHGSGAMMFWGDNSGSERFYYHRAKVSWFADTLPACIKRFTDPISPCYTAIYQYLSIGMTIDDTTIYAGIHMTSRYNVYIEKDDQICAKSKRLNSYQDCDPNFTLEKLMSILLGGIKDIASISASITGGTDSRCILAHLLEQGVQPRLCITGREGDKDVIIAHVIADKLGLPLCVYDPTKKDPNWLETGYSFCNGIYDVVLSYRHFMKARTNMSEGIEYEFGGTGGEFYKNYYSRPFRHAQMRKLTAKDILHNIVGSGLLAKSWYGEKLIAIQNKVCEQANNSVKQTMENGFLRNHNLFGETLLTATSANVTGIVSPLYTEINPLMDRNVIASVCWKNPLSLSMARWLRKEISTHYPAISDIPTDKGYSCTIRNIPLLCESIRSLWTYVQKAVARVQRIVKKKRKSCINIWAQDYIDAKALPEYERSVNACKELGIISHKVMPDDIPLDKVGFILMIGMSFRNMRSNAGKESNGVC